MRSPGGSLLGLLAFVLLLSAPVWIHAAEPVPVTISDLVRAPQQYTGREVMFDGLLVEMGYLNAYGPSASAGRSRLTRYQFAVADMSGARMLIITYLPSYDLPDLSLVGKTGTPYSVSGVFYHVPIEPGPPLQFVVPNSKGGLRRK